jgi:hypothetical protein
MRSVDVTQSEFFSYRTLEQRIPPSHPLRKLRALVDSILGTLSGTTAPLPSERRNILRSQMGLGILLQQCRWKGQFFGFLDE